METWTCLGCGHENEETSTDEEFSQYSDYLWGCDGCGGMWKADDNFTVNHAKS